jgi:hypothetical protein
MNSGIKINTLLTFVLEYAYVFPQAFITVILFESTANINLRHAQSVDNF